MRPGTDSMLPQDGAARVWRHRASDFRLLLVRTISKCPGTSERGSRVAVRLKTRQKVAARVVLGLKFAVNLRPRSLTNPPPDSRRLIDVQTSMIAVFDFRACSAIRRSGNIAPKGKTLGTPSCDARTVIALIGRHLLHCIRPRRDQRGRVRRVSQGRFAQASGPSKRRTSPSPLVEPLDRKRKKLLSPDPPSGNTRFVCRMRAPITSR